MRRELNPARVRWHDRREHGECGRCGDRLAKDYDKSTCPPCLKRVREAVRARHYESRGLPIPPLRQERAVDRLKFVAATTVAGMSTVEQARHLGVRVTSVYRMREKAGVKGRYESEAWAKIDTSGARCRCGLRLPCNNCLPTRADGTRRIAWDVL